MTKDEEGCGLVRINMFTCQKAKVEHQRPGGNLQPLEIPLWKWDNMFMDFVTHLPRTFRRHDTIWVIVDRLTKSAHFLAMNLRMSMAKLAQLYIKEIVRLHGVPSSIVSDRDQAFAQVPWPLSDHEEDWAGGLPDSLTPAVGEPSSSVSCLIVEEVRV